MKFRLVVGTAPDRGARSLSNRIDVGAATLTTDSDVVVEETRGGVVALIGTVAGRITSGRALDRVSDLRALARSAAHAPDLRVWADSVEGSFAVVHVNTDGTARVAADRFATRDVYLQSSDGVAAAASSLDLLPRDPRDGGFDQMVLAHGLLVYGTRAPKRHTNHPGTTRLGVGDVATLSAGIDVRQQAFDPVPTTPWGRVEHEEYADTFLDAIEARGSRHGNIVYLSSGWDSTSILAGLVQVFGRRRVRALIGRMRYSERSGICNQFEIDRAASIAEHFGVPLEIVELDYITGADEVVAGVRDLFRNQGMASLTGLNHARLAAGAAATATADEVVFAGEISDGVHNFGFSQFVTMFHPSHEFREYADKMGSYLFGPTFVRAILDGSHDDDVVYRLFRDRAVADFEEPATTSEGRMAQVLASLFIRPVRVPLSAQPRGRILTDEGVARYRAEIEDAYLGDAARRAEPSTLYSWYLHIYNSFHWQGSTVATLQLTAEAAGLRSALPFWDTRLHDSLSAMPEECGRGLDLNSTKYPLKWTLRNRIEYPYHLQVGPHSYTYDVDPGFNHSIELLYHSSLRQVFVDALETRPYREVLDPAVFDLTHIDGLVGAFLDGKELRGADLNELVTVGLTSVYGWYG